MMAVPRYPRQRKAASRLQRVTTTLKRAWITHQIIGAQVEIRSIQNMIDNDVAVIRKYPDMQERLLPVIDRYFLEQQAISQRLNMLNIKFLQLSHAI